MGVLTRISAVRVIDPLTGNSKEVYAQLDSGSEVTLISTSLAQQLGLTLEEKPQITLHTISGSTKSDFYRMSFDLQALHTGERFSIQKALVMPTWSDEIYTLPHDYDLSFYHHFHDVSIITLPTQSQVDILLGLDNSYLMKVLEERTGTKNELHTIHTQIGWVASEGWTPSDDTCYSRKIAIQKVPDERDRKIMELQETIRDLNIENEKIQPTVSDV